MGKIRVHELAKELGKSSADVIAYLAGKGLEVKASNGLDDDLAAKVRANLGAGPKAAEPSEKASSAPAAPKAPQPKAEVPAAPAAPAAKPEEAPKKKKFVAVFRRENARSGVISRMPTRPQHQ